MKESIKEFQLNISRLDTVVDGIDSTVLAAFCVRPKAGAATYDHAGAFVGTVQVQFEGRLSACLRQLFVAFDYRRQGFGEKLIHECAHIARAADCESLSLLLDAKNRELLPWYRKMGFAVSMDYPVGDLALTMRLAKYTPAWEGERHA